MRTPFRHLSWLVIPLHACSGEPTSVSIHLTTDVPCDRLGGVSLTVGTLGPLEAKAPVKRTVDCKDGEIGTLTVVPSGGDDGEFGVRVVMGIGRDAESCTAPTYGPGCVVARRGLRFLPNETITVPIALRESCNGNACGPTDTCVKGTCVPATLDPALCKTASGCGEDVLLTTAPDGGTTDGGADGSGEGGTSPNADPISAIQPYCGFESSVDYTAPWPIRGGCASLAHRTRYRGPKVMPVITPVDTTSGWSSLVIDDKRGYGESGGALKSFDIATRTVAPVDFAGTGFTFAAGDSCAITASKVLCRTRNDLLSFDRGATPVGGSGRGSFHVKASDGGVEPTMPMWNLATQERWIVTVLSGPGIDLHSLTSLAGSDKSVTIAGLSLKDLPTKDGLLFVPLSSEVSMFAVDNMSVIGQTPASTASVGVADRSGYLHTVIQNASDGGFDYSLRSYANDGTVIGGDIALLGGNDFNGVLAAGTVDDANQSDLILVLRANRLEALKMEPRGTLWSVPMAAAVRMVWTTDGYIYVAGGTNFVAIDPKDGNERFATGAPWSNVNELAMGPDGALYVAAGNGLFRIAAP